MSNLNNMDYKIKKGEIYHCIRDFVMDDESIAYTKDGIKMPI